MNCENCGAAMQLVESRRYFRCLHCATFHFPEPVEKEGIRIVGHTEDAPRCPVCGDRMDHAVIDKDFPVSFCGKCRGVLLPRASFARIVNGRRSWTSDPPVIPPPMDRAALDRPLICPMCAARFSTYPYSGPGNVVIDNCIACDLIWLDFGEMRQIVDAPGKDRGDRQRLPERDGSVEATPPPLTPSMSPGEPLGFLYDLARLLD
jgi:Zn-finger nucleic acid-binding protein